MSETINIGRKILQLDYFKMVVANSKSYPDVVDRLGMNKTVTTHMKNVKKVCEENNVDTSHLKIWKSDNYITPLKQYSLSSDNQKYFDAFENNEAVKESSKAAYRSGIGMFLEVLRGLDCGFVSPDDIKMYINSKEGSEDTKKNAQAHVNALLKYIVKNDINGAYGKVSKDLIIYLWCGMGG